jgi:7-alpha-hydroxysteroid dehydrogenase
MMLAERFRLNGKVAVVTGSGKGIGQSIGLALAEAGANVVFSARTEGGIQAGAEKAKRFGVQALAIPCNVTDDGQLQKLVAKTVEAFGGIDILVNNAGGTHGVGPNRIPTTSRQWCNEMLDFNVTSALMSVRFCLPHLKQRNGCVINICSSVGRVVQNNFTVYGSAKAALIHMTRLMASDLAPDVRVNGIAPGSILTDALREVLDEVGLQKMSQLMPMKRLGDTDDIAMAAVYLASPAASWVTGKIMEVDGGQEAGFELF